jgi:hypothetical protein
MLRTMSYVLRTTYVHTKSRFPVPVPVQGSELDRKPGPAQNKSRVATLGVILIITVIGNFNARSRGVSADDPHNRTIETASPTHSTIWDETGESYSAADHGTSIGKRSRELIHIPSHWEPGNRYNASVALYWPPVPFCEDIIPLSLPSLANLREPVDNPRLFQTLHFAACIDI